MEREKFNTWFTGLYLAACKARHPNWNIKYNDIDKKYGCDIVADMLTVSTYGYAYLIATPPCNFYSKINYRYYRSKYAWQTINLLPLVLMKFAETDKPFIVENVINRKKFEFLGIYKLCDYLGIFYQEVGRHTYFTNVKCDLSCEQHQDFRYGGYRVNTDGYNQGGSNVAAVIEKWLDFICTNYDMVFLK